MPADAGSLEAANQAFYDAFEALELDAMDTLWDHGDDVWCVHPGSEVISGWDRVHRSWAAVFANASYLQFIVTDVTATVAGEVGCVTCTENILSGHGDAAGLGAGKAVATNVFVWRGERWRMLGHHASPVVRSFTS